MSDYKECPLCGESAYLQPDYQRDLAFYICSVCGCFELKILGNERNEFSRNKAASYVFYNRFLSNSFPSEYRYHTFRTKEECDKYNEAFEKSMGNEPKDEETDVEESEE